MKYYKLVKEIDGVLMSYVAAARDIPTWYEVEYKPNEWVYPKLKPTRLYCFNDLPMAREYIGWSPQGLPTQLWECEVQEPARCRILTSFAGMAVLNNYVDRIPLLADIDYSYYLLIPNDSNTRIGTNWHMSATAIKLTEKIA